MKQRAARASSLFARCCLLAAHALGASACGSDDVGGGGASASAGATTTSDTTTTSDASGAGGAGGGVTTAAAATSSTSTGLMNCTEIALEDFKSLGPSPPNPNWYYSSAPQPALGLPAVGDLVQLEVHGDSAARPGADGEALGTFDLASDDGGNYATCARCLLVVEDAFGNESRSYFPVAGTITVDRGSDPLKGKLSATLSDVSLVEVTIDPTTGFESTPVDDGACLHLASATVSVGL